MLEYSSREVLNMVITSKERLEYIKNWQKENKDKIKERRMKISASFNAKTESHYIEVFRSIPNKAEFFRKCLDDYEKEQRR